VAFLLSKNGVTMTTETPTTETVETPAQVAEVTEVTPVEEPFDKDRAMNTITKLRGIEAQAKKDLKELETLKAEKKQREDAALSETERLTKQAKELSEKNAKLEGDLIRRDVIAETGLPATFADRLKGTTKDELLADAQELAKTLPQLKVAPKLPPTNPSNTTTVSAEQEVRAKLWPNGSRLDKETIARLGGGVVLKE
jgi:hypothetical protein